MTGLVFLSSCDDNLELENPNQKTTSSFWKTSDDLESGVATIYNTLVDNNNAGYWEIQAMQHNDLERHFLQQNSLFCFL